jgi:hypothetical protein
MKDIQTIRSDLACALNEWKNVGGHVDDLVDHIEGLISSKVHEILQSQRG